MESKRITARLKKVETRLDALTLPCTPSFLTHLAKRVQEIEESLEGLRAQLDRR